MYNLLMQPCLVKLHVIRYVAASAAPRRASVQIHRATKLLLYLLRMRDSDLVSNRSHHVAHESLISHTLGSGPLQLPCSWLVLLSFYTF
jgi:hypothetical protein